MFEILSYDSALRMQIISIKRELGFLSFDLHLFIILIAMIYSIIILLIYYKVSEIVAVKISQPNTYTGENLLVTIALTETVCYVITLLLLSFRVVDMNTMGSIIPLVGTILLGVLLYGNYSFKFILAVLFVRSCFYLSNGLVILFNLIK